MTGGYVRNPAVTEFCPSCGWPVPYHDGDRCCMVDCPQCNGSGMIVPGATVGMWAGLVSWPDPLQAETCDLCDGDGQVQAGVAARYEAERALDVG